MADYQPALNWTMPELAEIMTAAFEGYLVPVQMTAHRMARLLLADGVDLTLSTIAVDDGRPQGLGLITRRGWACRLAGMGVFKGARGRGVGKRLLAHLIEAASARGDREIVLEVIEQNAPAVALYRGAGFETIRRLVGYRLDDPQGVVDKTLRPVDVREAARALVRHGPADLPWQNAPEVFANMGLDFSAFRLDRAHAVVIAQSEIVVLQSVVVAPEARGQGQATRLLRALMAHFPGRTWRVPITWPHELAPGLFQRLGFEREALSQFQMRLALD